MLLMKKMKNCKEKFNANDHGVDFLWVKQMSQGVKGNNLQIKNEKITVIDRRYSVSARGGVGMETKNCRSEPTVSSRRC